MYLSSTVATVYTVGMQTCPMANVRLPNAFDEEPAAPCAQRLQVARPVHLLQLSRKLQHHQQQLQQSQINQSMRWARHNFAETTTHSKLSSLGPFHKL